MPSVPQQRAAIEDVEHGSSRFERWLRVRWVSLAAGVALAEGLLIVLGMLSKTVALIVAAGVVVAYFTVNKRSYSPFSRLVARTAAVSQGLVLFIPLFLFVLEAAAITALVIIGVLAVTALLRRRR